MLVSIFDLKSILELPIYRYCFSICVRTLVQAESTREFRRMDMKRSAPDVHGPKWKFFIDSRLLTATIPFNLFISLCKAQRSNA